MYLIGILRSTTKGKSLCIPEVGSSGDDFSSIVCLDTSNVMSIAQKLPSLSTTAQIRYTIAADCSVELWEGALLRKIEQDRIPH